MMPFVAFGMVVRGFSVSPAVMPMSSVPPKLNITTTSAISRPVHVPSALRVIRPCGRNPPSTVNQLAKLARMPEAVGTLAITTYRPPRIMASTATILMMANQNSNSPNLFTPMRFSAAMATRNTAADTHFGMFGNQ